ncbi:MAG: hypothetical protein NT154_31100 [Verrucomicrobia bacterium]|nr:hypothetical protein [Verrucomicrobiota bacterium]
MKIRPSPSALTLVRALHASVAADGSRRIRSARKMAPTAVGGYAVSRDPARCEMSGTSASQHAYFLVEALVYIAVVCVVLGAGYAAMYRCVDSSIALRRNVDDITSALHAGERWRADVRSATNGPRLENTNGGQLFHLDGPKGVVIYRYSTNAIFRSVGAGPWVRLLPNVRASKMEADPRQHVTAWRWELELATRNQGSFKPGRVRPLFTFIAIPERPSSK